MVRQGPPARPVRRAGPGPRQGAGNKTAQQRPAPPRRPRKILGGNAKPRIMVGRLLLVFVLTVAGLRLVYIQGIQAPSLSAQAEQQRSTSIDTAAQRGTITDRNGTKLAFSVGSDAIYFQPSRTRKQWNAKISGETYDQYVQQIIDYLPQVLGNAVDKQTLQGQLTGNATFVYLDKLVPPTVAEAINNKFSFIGIETRSLREYPNGTVASNVIGLATWQSSKNSDGTVSGGSKGVIGLESAMNDQLAGTPGKELADTEAGNDKVIIPGTARDVTAPVNGDDVQLTIDTDLQYEVQQLLAQYVAAKGARDGSAVVMDVKTGQVYALADDQSFDPNDTSTITNQNSGNEAVTTPFEPGSVNKIVTMAAALNAGLVTPTSVVDVPSVLNYPYGVTIHDDWNHSDYKMTVTGIFAKSSNIGTDELAQQVGPNGFDAMLTKMGLGTKTGVGLPGESSGSVPPMKSWNGATFHNLPFGQGLTVTILQMADEYQAIANGGVRIPPRIIQSVTKPDGTVQITPQPAGVRVVTPQTASTLLGMMRYVTQSAPSPNEGTAVSAALPGYQISGKTGTAQQVVNGQYSHSANTVTFVGILSADNPRFVVAVMLDRPSQGGESAQTAAPLFHDIASYIVSRYNLPVSTQPVPFVPLVVSQ
jgi:cell division protein FtsI (penicillin-binding protein 3)